MQAVRLILIGLGNRAGKYMSWISSHPDEAVVVAAIDPDRLHRDFFKKKYGIPTVLERIEDFEGEADAVIIASPDATHHAYSLYAISRGWHILLEKPIATSPEDCESIVCAAREAGVLVSVCHVLRFHPYFLKLKELASNPEMGRLLSISHKVNIGLDRMTHTFVRGLWSKAEDSSPLVLSKCSHDIDLLVWLCNDSIADVSSTGSLSFYKAGKAPAGATDRCVLCPLESTCLYSAVDLYLRRDSWNKGFIPEDGETKEDAILEELKTGRYGRCVFACDNDVVDNQIVRMTTLHGAEVTLEIDGLSSKDNRETSILFENGRIDGDGNTIRVTTDGHQISFDYSEQASSPLHAGADMKIIEHFIGALRNKENLASTSASEALVSHLICFKAEESRRSCL